VLIGGLGMGFTLAGVLRDLGNSSAVVIAELVPAVVAWNRGPLAAFAGNPLADPRVDVRELDVGQVIRAEEGVYDAILLDVDNGPAGLTSKTNDWLYGVRGLRAAHAALRPGGILAVWSAGADAAFTKRLQQNGFAVEEVRVRGRGKSGGSRFLIWLAQRR
jgi:spermidine synthase